MKATTLQKRIEKNLFTKKNELHSKYAKVIWLICHSDAVIHPRSWSYNGNRMRLTDCSHQYLYALTVLGIDFETGNDAPRGGAQGYFIRLTKKGRNQVKDFALISNNL